MFHFLSCFVAEFLSKRSNFNILYPFVVFVPGNRNKFLLFSVGGWKL